MTAIVTLVPFTAGQMTLDWSFFLDGAPGIITAPVTAYLIEHPVKGTAVFDSGLGPRFRRPNGAPLDGPADLTADGTIDARITAAGYDPAAVSIIVNSHLHTDHAGGNQWLPNARVVVQEAEWRYANSVYDPVYHLPKFDTGQPIEPIGGEHDLFGDGSVVIYPTPGHTPGHQSARVRTAAGEAILAGDACNLRDALDQLRLPDHTHDADAYRASLHDFARRRDAGAEIFFSHDPDFWAAINKGTPWKGPIDGVRPSR
ncbi:N-acyl homoserine lactonase family protein [Paractinoplanes lichenicola]|uniref:N-acyl homoserine lactonase family protein n=1 Tax=Paractinoplanes lichenicola TaxID=2802976 RepID=A0ABS1VMN3_9ACTN|nr:N-acyl homoserine lactonase family protein [Actinoplanes lichenicola]MBL7255986.1 N-acyl homoserine lactonase family protein [Actinoplanes lichenicola]